MLSTELPLKEFEQSFQAFIHEKLSEPSPLHEAMKYSLFSGGKRIRPIMALESAKIVNLSKDAALHFAFAIEMVHGFSLVHDDLPCLDNDDFRRGKPTTHKVYGEAIALLAGDALLNLALETFALCSKYVESDAFIKAFQLFTRATHGMILGQANELSMDSSNLDQLLKIQSLKTSELFKASILCPLLLSGMNETNSIYQECEIFSEGFGFAFQIADDLVDEAQDQTQKTKNILSHLGRETAVKTAVKKLTSSIIAEKFSSYHLLLNQLK